MATTSGDSGPTLESRATSKERVDEGSRSGATEDEEEANAQKYKQQGDEPELFVVLQVILLSVKNQKDINEYTNTILCMFSSKVKILL